MEQVLKTKATRATCVGPCSQTPSLSSPDRKLVRRRGGGVGGGGRDRPRHDNLPG